jgi:MFS transporter, FHS family, glucose/mannose:H+ symporter
MESSSESQAAANNLLLYMHGAFFLTGIGVLMLGPLLPMFSQAWHVADGKTGMLLAAQFAGSFSGAVLLQADLRKSLTLGSFCLMMGYGMLGFSAGCVSGFTLGFASLLVGGFGIGQVVNSVSLIAAKRSREKQGASLMSLNLTWSAGALLAPLLIALSRRYLSLQVMLLLFASGAASLLLFQLLLISGASPGHATGSGIAGIWPRTTLRGNALRLLLYFSSLFFLYGALENSVTGWIATFSIRYAHSGVSVGAYSTTALWVGITAGRAFGLILLRRFTEKSIQVAGVIVTICALALLRSANSPWKLLPVAIVLGAGLATFIPLTCSLFLERTRTSPRQAGFVMATSALGGAVLPLSVGVLSQHYQSLKLALGLPILVGVLLLLACILTPPQIATAEE